MNIPSMPSHSSYHLAILINRIAVGWYVAMAGWTKVTGEIRNGLGTFFRSDSFQGRNPSWLPDFVALPYGYALPWLELTVGALVLAGLFGRVAPCILAFLLLSIGMALLGAGELLPRHHLMLALSIAVLLAVTGPGRYSLDCWLPGRRGRG